MIIKGRQLFPSTIAKKQIPIKKIKHVCYLQSKTNEFLVFVSEWVHKSERLF